MKSPWIMFGCISGFLAVAMGAFGAHALAASLSERGREVYHTAAQYQMTHALALVALGLWCNQHPGQSGAVAGWAFTLGSVLFSGSLYALALTNVNVLGAITPFGGLGFLIGWVAFAILARKG